MQRKITCLVFIVLELLEVAIESGQLLLTSYVSKKESVPLIP
jgi:hypothetical protein